MCSWTLHGTGWRPRPRTRGINKDAEPCLSDSSPLLPKSLPHSIFFNAFAFAWLTLHSFKIQQSPCFQLPSHPCPPRPGAPSPRGPSTAPGNNPADRCEPSPGGPTPCCLLCSHLPCPPTSMPVGWMRELRHRGLLAAHGDTAFGRQTEL